ncbi:MAG TPA: MopE-related protein, partial [Myxococcota bacterium]|nr:MopE-related protein [Myxococcota bacterium]
MLLAAAGVSHGQPDVCDAYGPLDTPTPVSEADARLVGGDRYEQFGSSVANLGDINGDGFDDIAIGAPGNDTNELEAGAVYVYYGPVDVSGAIGPDVADLVLFGASRADRSGWVIAPAGDVDADGYADFLVGGNRSTSAVQSAPGFAYLVLGSPELPGAAVLSEIAVASFKGTLALTLYGSALGGVGDVNGDGFDDVAIGDPAYNSQGADSGALRVWFGPVEGGIHGINDADLILQSDRRGARFGGGVGRVGDLNRDGYDDIVVGAPLHKGIGTRGGAVYVFYGRADLNGVVSARFADVVVYGDRADQLGMTIAAAGDVDGDSRPDVWVGAPDWSSQHRGAAYLFSAAVFDDDDDVEADDIYSFRATGADGSDLFGSSVSGNADFNGDGVLDVVVGASLADGPYTKFTGAAWVIHGPFLGEHRVSLTEGVLYGEDKLAKAGAAVSACGDLNGDGFDDVLVGAPRANGQVDKSGAVGLFYGGHDVDDETPYYRDADGDGWGVAEDSLIACERPTGYVGRAGDCDDSLAAVRPFVLETSCGSPVDWNCDGSIGAVDSDGDGFTACGGDCDDRQVSVHVGAPELCGDELDNDCNGPVDDPSSVDAITWYPDLDHDSFGDRLVGVRSCTLPSFFLVPPVTVGGDCDDANARVRPYADEWCDGYDNNCDDRVDEPSALDAGYWYRDADSDGYGQLHDIGRGCTVPEGYSATSGDCDDTDSQVRPGRREICDFKDNDCDGQYYRGGPMQLSEWNTEIHLLGDEENDQFGDHLTFAMDMNGDGLDEFAVSAPNSSIGPRNSGVVYVFHGHARGGSFDAGYVSADGVPLWAARIAGSRTSAKFGEALASGDLNGDGIGDLIIGAPGNSGGGINAGALHVFLGPVTGALTADNATATFTGKDSNDKLGEAIATGDIDRDGFTDILVGAPGADGVGSRRGAYYVLYGRPEWVGGRIEDLADARLYGEEDREELGTSVAILGDVNGDGARDIAGGSPSFGPSDTGVVRFNLGIPDNRFAGELITRVRLTTDDIAERIGSSIAAVGDVNGDGQQDVAVGGSGGHAWLLYGGSRWLIGGDLLDLADVEVGRGDPGEIFGEIVAYAGDVNGDGLSDVMFSAALANAGGIDSGAVYLLYGNRDLPTPITAALFESRGRLEEGTTWPTYSVANRSRDRRLYEEFGGYNAVEGAKLIGVAAGDELGRAMAGAYDVNGDGFSDLLLGSAHHERERGEARVLFGGRYGLDMEVHDIPHGGWSLPLRVDGHRDDWKPEIMRETSTAGLTDAVTWDPRNLYLGVSGNDVRTGGTNHAFVAYFGDGKNGGARVGLSLVGSPTLPFSADYAVVWVADGSLQAWARWTGTTWSVVPSGLAAQGVVVAENNAEQTMEMSIPWASLGDPDELIMASEWWFRLPGFGQAWGAMPASALTDGASPNIASSIRIKRTNSLAPGSYPDNGFAMPSVEDHYTRWWWDRDLDIYGDDARSELWACAMHVPQWFPDPIHLTYTDDARAYAVTEAPPSTIPELGQGILPGPLTDCDDWEEGAHPNAPEIDFDLYDWNCDGYDNNNKPTEVRVHIERDTSRDLDDTEIGTPRYADVRFIRVGDTATARMELFDDDVATIDEGPFDYDYQWFLNGRPLEGEDWYRVTDQRYWVKGDLLEVWIWSNDYRLPQGPFVGVTTIANTRPVVTQCWIEPGRPTDDDRLDARWTAYDVDGDRVTMRFQWYIDRLLDTDQRLDRIPGFLTRPGQEYQAECTPYDGEDNGLEMLSQPVTIPGAPLAACADDTNEDNDVPILATQITPTTSPDLNGAEEAVLLDLVVCPEDLDWYSVLVPPGYRLQVTEAHLDAEGDVDVAITDGSGTVLDEETGAHTPSSASVYTDPDAAGPYVLLFVRATLTEDSGHELGAEYSLAFLLSPIEQNGLPPQEECDVTDQFEPNNRTLDAAELGVGLAYTPMYVCPGDDDWFELPTLATPSTFTLMNPSDAVDVHLFRNVVVATPTQHTELLEVSASLAVSADTVIDVPAAGPTEQQTFIRVRRNRDATEPAPVYGAQFDGVLPPPPTSPCVDDWVEQNDVLGQAYGTAADNVALGSLVACPSDADWYCTDIPARTTTAFGVARAGTPGIIYMELYDDGGSGDMVHGHVLYDRYGYISVQNPTDQVVPHCLKLYSDDAPVTGIPYTLWVDSVPMDVNPNTPVVGGGTVTTPSCSDDWMDNDTLQTALRTINYDCYTIQMCADDVDYYALTVAPDESARFEVLFTGASGDLNVRLLDASGAVVATGQTMSTGEFVEFFSVAGGTYYLEVTLNTSPGAPPVAAAGVTYDVHVFTIGQCVEDVYDESGAGNDSLETATPITGISANGGMVSLIGMQSCGTDEDWYAVTLLPNERLRAHVVFEHDDGDIDIRLYDNQWRLKTSSEGATDVESVTFAASTGGTYYLQVFTYWDTQLPPGTSYDVYFTIEPPTTAPTWGTTSCHVDYLEPNDNAASGILLEYGDSFQLLTSCTGNDDWFKVNLSQGEYLNMFVLFGNNEGNVNVYLYLNGTQKAKSTRTSNNEWLQYTAPTAGIYDVKVTLSSDAGTRPGNIYTLIYGVTPPGGPEAGPP